jgi:hypothetical protein
MRAPMPDRFDFTPTVFILIQLFFSVLSQRSSCGIIVHAIHQDVQTPVVVEIADGATAAGYFFKHAWSGVE